MLVRESEIRRDDVSRTNGSCRRLGIFSAMFMFKLKTQRPAVFSGIRLMYMPVHSSIAPSRIRHHGKYGNKSTDVGAEMRFGEFDPGVHPSADRFLVFRSLHDSYPTSNHFIRLTHRPRCP